MVRLTADLIADSPQFTNPVSDRELDLRGMLCSPNSAHQIVPPGSMRSSLHVYYGRLAQISGVEPNLVPFLYPILLLTCQCSELTM